MTEPTDAPKDASEEEADEKETPDLLKPWVATSLAAIALFGAGLAVLQTDASVSESNTARETTRTAIAAESANVIESSVAGIEGDLMGERDSLGFRSPFLPPPGDLVGAAGGESSSAAERQQALADARDGLPGKRTDEVLRALQLDTATLSLKQAALAETRVTWNDRSTQYTTVIAFLAVALFLVGFALVVGGPLRPAFFAGGLVAALICVGWAAWIYSLSIPETPDDAIAATASGEVLTGEGAYRRAVASFDDAVEADDDYAPAYAGRAIAKILAANPDFLVTGAVTEMGFGAAEGSIDDALEALDLDSRDTVTLAVLALIAFYAGEYQQSIDAADDALALNDQVPDTWLLRSASQLGLGQVDAADASLQAGLGLLTDFQPSRRTRELAASYIDYMEWLIANEPDVASDAEGFEQVLVSRETGFTLDREIPDQAPATGSARVEGLRYADGRLRLTLRWNSLPDNTALTAIGFERPIAGGAWSQPSELALFRNVGGTGREVGNVPLARSCKPTEVRVDLYLDGERVQSSTGPGVAATCP